MKDSLSSIDKMVLSVLARTRGARVDELVNFPCLKNAGSAEALRKRLERLASSGFLAISKLPLGKQLFRLSSKGVRLTGAPSAYANSPSPAISAEMLSVSSLASKTDEFQFLTKAESETLLRELFPDDPEAPSVACRLVLRRAKCRSGDEQSNEPRLHLLVSELRTPDELAARVNTILANASRNQSFKELIESGVVGVTIVVATESAKKSVAAKAFQVETSVEVVERLQDLFS